MLLKSVILLALLFSSIFAINSINQAYASSSFVTVYATDSGGTTILSVSNNANSTSDLVSFSLKINGVGVFKSFHLDNGWLGMKTSPTTLVFNAANPLKPGEISNFEIKTDQQTPLMTWSATDAKDVEIGSGNIGTSTPAVTPPPPETHTPSGTGIGSQTGSPPVKSLVGVLDTSTFRIIPSAPSPGSHIRIVGMSFSPLASLGLYIGNDKIGSFNSNENGNFVATLVIPDSKNPGGVNFLIKDQQGNQKTFSTNLKTKINRVNSSHIPLTLNIDPILHRGENRTISGTANPDTTLTLTLFDSQGTSITTYTGDTDKNGVFSKNYIVPVGIEFGKYSITVSDGKNQVSKQFIVETTHSISVSTSSDRYEPGQTVFVNGTSTSNKIVNFAIADVSGHQIYSKDVNVTSTGHVEMSYKLENSAIKGTYSLTVTQGDDISILYFGVGEDLAPGITAKLDRLVYRNADRPIITVTGPPSSTLNLVVIDPGNKQKFADVINIGPEGQTTYSFNLTSYTTGIYSIVVSHATQKVEKSFAIGAAVGGGKITLKTIKDIYLPGDNIIIIGNANPNILLQISLTDPNDNIVKSIQTFSDKTGHFSSFVFKIPPIATPGVWRLDGVSGVAHDSEFLIVKSKAGGITIDLDRASGSYTRGDAIRISGSSAGVTASVSIKIANGDTLVDTLQTSATNRGDFSTYWKVPKTVNPGSYTIEASSITGKATISLRIQ